MLDVSPCSGYVLVGGGSSRMGRDKALLRYAGGSLAEYVAGQVEEAAGSAVFVGPPERYRELGREVIADLHPGNGPIGGIETALAHSATEWTMVVACDMPGVRAAFLRDLLERASPAIDCVVPLSPAGLAEPLCTAWRRTCLPEVRAAIEDGRRKLQGLFERLRTDFWRPATAAWLENLNTPGDWQAHQSALSAAAGPKQGESVDE